MTHRPLDNLLRLILPVLGINIARRNLLSLFLWSTPRNLDISELIVGVKYLWVCQYEE
jgi:hypothetical protein